MTRHENEIFISKLILVLRTDKIDIAQLCDMSFIGLAFGKLSGFDSKTHGKCLLMVTRLSDMRDPRTHIVYIQNV